MSNTRRHWSMCHLSQVTVLFLACVVGAGPAEASELGKKIWGCHPGAYHNTHSEDLLWLVNAGQDSYIKFYEERFPARYQLKGLNRRWDWDTSPDFTYNYAVILEPDGLAKYYDFSRAEPGETVKAAQYFRCKQIQ